MFFLCRFDSTLLLFYVWGVPCFLDTSLFKFALSFFEVNGRQRAVVRVLSFRVAKQLNVREHVALGFLPRPIGPASDYLAFDQLAEDSGARAAGTGMGAAVRRALVGSAQKNAPKTNGEMG